MRGGYILSLRDSFFLDAQLFEHKCEEMPSACIHTISRFLLLSFLGLTLGLGDGWWKEGWGDNFGVLATGSGDIFGFCFVCFAFGGGRFLNRELWVCGVGGGDMQRVSIYRIEHLRLFFGGMMGQRTARIASSNTVLRPFWVRAEHSRYLTAPISLAMASPCG